MEIAVWAASKCLLCQLPGMFKAMFVFVCCIGNIAQGKVSSIAIELHMLHQSCKCACQCYIFDSDTHTMESPTLLELTCNERQTSKLTSDPSSFDNIRQPAVHAICSIFTDVTTAFSHIQIH